MCEPEDIKKVLKKIVEILEGFDKRICKLEGRKSLQKDIVSELLNDIKEVK